MKNHEPSFFPFSEEQRVDFSRSRFLAMPIAGAIAWTVIALASPFVSVNLAAWILFMCTGMIFALIYLIPTYVLAKRLRPN